MADFPAMPLWTDAYLADTRHLSRDEHGAYLLLMMEAWRRPRCSLPDDDSLLARLTCSTAEEWARIKPAVMAFWTFDARASEWTQKRLSKEHVFVREKRRKNRDAAASRWEKTKKTDANASFTQCERNAPTPTPTPTKIQEPPSGQKTTPDLLSSNGLDPAEKPKAAKRVEATADDFPDFISHEVAEGFLEHRRAKRAKLTPYALKLMTKELTQIRSAGIDPNDALNYAIKRNWTGCEAEWVIKAFTSGQGEESEARKLLRSMGGR